MYVCMYVCMCVCMLTLHMTQRKVTAAQRDDSQFAGYRVTEAGTLDKQSKVNWPASQWVNLFEMLHREGIVLKKQGDTFVYELELSGKQCVVETCMYVCMYV